MAAPSIPHLLGLRSGDRGGRNRRNGAASTAASPDAAVQGTDTDAAVSRLSAVDLGYLDDAYARLFVTGLPTRRLPIINRGTYVRTTSLDAMIHAFLSQNGSSAKQIISLGAGTDTRPLHMFQRPGAENIIYHELDFESTCQRKRAIIQSSPGLRHLFRDLSIHDNGSWSAEPSRGGSYHCHAVDLRDLAKSTGNLPSHVRSDLPTLLLSECCLCYLTPQDSEDVLRFFTSRINSIAALLYEPMPLGDAFGEVMMSNLRARRIHMPSLEKYKDQEGQVSRLRGVGLGSTGYATISDAWDTWVDCQERERVDGLEGLDEVEEWKLLAAHYLVVWGSRGVELGSRTGEAVVSGATATSGA
ncbi:hypothetical protein E4U36_005690 [Claviceps purpurea]|nr:hypothetical protein E4U36_005690 [Claviceps purpurea]